MDRVFLLNIETPDGEVHSPSKVPLRTFCGWVLMAKDVKVTNAVVTCPDCRH